jgi:Holliday junction resolvase RusA-like endonuclease
VPAPPSVNAAFRNTARGRALTQKAVDWKGHAGWVLRQQRPRHVPGEVAVIVNVERNSASADIDNKVKLLLDLLVAHNVIEDDKRVASIAAAWIPKHSAMAHVAILPAGQLDLLRFHPAASNGACSGWIIPAPFHEEEEAHDGL